MSDHSIHCAANGCPMLGTQSDSTKGWDHGARYYCFLHFGCKAGASHAITNELDRLNWLVKITQGVRALLAGGGGAGDYIAAAHKEIRLNQSSHLLLGDHESLSHWLYRLEDTLRAACAAATEPQQPLEV